MDARGIKAYMGLRGEGPNDIARAISTPQEQEHVSEVSKVLKYDRANERIRRKIAVYWNLPYDDLWDGDPSVAMTGSAVT
jgi:hypothetical protein